MDTTLEEQTPQPVDEPGIKALQEAGHDAGTPPEERRGGALAAATLPDALEGIFIENPRGLATDAGGRLLLAWVRDQHNRVTSMMQTQEQLIRALTVTQGQAGAEKEKRVAAELRLKGHERFAPLVEVCLISGMALFSLSVVHMHESSIAPALSMIGVVLILVALLVPRGKK